MSHVEPDGTPHSFEEAEWRRLDIEYIKTRPNCVSMWVSPNIEGKKSLSFYRSSTKMFERPKV